jgi:hypothetical protein
MSKDVFNEKWQKHIDKAVIELSKTHTSEKVEYLMGHLYRGGFRMWEYNQIVGYIRISLSKGAIWLDRYVPINSEKGFPSRFVYNSKQKFFMMESNVSGTHFPCGKMDNCKIADEINNWLQTIIEITNKHSKSIYFDLEQFYLLYKVIDYRKLIENKAT